MPTDTKSQARRLLPWVISQVLAAGTFSTHAATIAVDDTAGTVGGGGCTIRDAFTAANTDAAAAGCAAGSGADSIVLPSSATITLDTLDNSGINCLPLVDSNITIVGNGSTVRRSPTGDSCRLIEVTPTGSLTLQDTTLSGGFAYQQAAKGTTPNRDGGAIFSVGGNVTITGSTISGNSAVSGGGVAVKYATLLIQDSTVTGNTATLLGGGVYASGDGVVCSVGSNLTSNSAGAGGGAFVYNGFSPAKRKGAIIERAKSWQKATEKGNAFECKYEPGSASFIDSTVSGNTASGLTFTKGYFGYSAGGGVAVYGSLAYLYGSRFENNQADIAGGGINVEYGAALVVFSTVSGNTSGIGGGINTLYGYTLAYGSTVSDNEARLGGGTSTFYGFQGLFKSTVSGNRAVSGSLPATKGGPVYGSAGGIYGRYGVLFLEDSTVSGNSAQAEAGAIAWGEYNSPLFAAAVPVRQRKSASSDFSAPLANPIDATGFKYEAVTFLHSTIANNTAGGTPPVKGGAAFAVQFDTGDAVNLQNSIISNPGVGDCTTIDASDPSVIATLIRDGSCMATISGDPLLGPLVNNGGPTQTHLLLMGSSAASSGDPAVCAGADPTDQNGIPRPTDGVTQCSMGSTQSTVLGIPAAALPIPTLGEWARILMAGLLSLAAWAGLRRRRVTPKDPEVH